MRKGAIFITVEQSEPQSMSPMMATPFLGSLPSNVSVRNEEAFWEEKTGEKKGFILKRERKKRMAIQGFRCTGCGYIEIYASQK